MSDPEGFWRGRRVLLTGHTGFKGAWAALWLERAGAKVTGFALAPPSDRESLYACLSPWQTLESVIGDLNDREAVARTAVASDPEVIIHMAAQAIVRRSYREPIETLATNIMGTAHLLAAAMHCRSLRCIVVVTSDKVYDNRDAGQPFREDDPLAGDDPYSASKACAELVARSWRSSFLHDRTAPALGVVRAGNVVGGGDWGEDRLVPDVIRAGIAGKPVVLRYPRSTRPWQHVLDVISGYFAYVERLALEPDATPLALNFGPTGPSLRASELVETLQAEFGWKQGWTLAGGDPLPEKAHISLDPSRARETLGWRPKLAVHEALAWTARWHRAHLAHENMREVSLRQLADYASLRTDVGSATA